MSSYCHPKAFKTNADQFKIAKLKNEIFGEESEKREFDRTENKEIKKMLSDKVPLFLPNPEKNWGPKNPSRIKQTINYQKIEESNTNEDEQIYDDINK